jgi:hypothetical protein
LAGLGTRYDKLEFDVYILEKVPKILLLLSDLWCCDADFGLLKSGFADCLLPLYNTYCIDGLFFTRCACGIGIKLPICLY